MHPTTDAQAADAYVLQVSCGLGNELEFADPKAPRFVLWQGRLRPVPTGPGSLLASDLLSPGGKLRALAGALGLRPKPPGRPPVPKRRLAMQCQPKHCTGRAAQGNACCSCRCRAPLPGSAVQPACRCDSQDAVHAVTGVQTPAAVSLP